MREKLGEALREIYGEGEVMNLIRIPGGASKEAWILDYLRPDGSQIPLFLRRAAGGLIYEGTLPLEKEFRILEVAQRHGVKVAPPLLYLPDLEGKEAFVSLRVEGESIGRRVVTRPELQKARERLPVTMAEELARIHRLPREDPFFLPGPGAKEPWRWLVEGAYEDLDRLEEPHPALEWGLLWLKNHPALPNLHKSPFAQDLGSGLSCPSFNFLAAGGMIPHPPADSPRHLLDT
ncbi:MAG: phosphotransferase [Bacillota bacterium]|nr:phosphotransferase [Bacillota bacterium]